MVTAVQFVFIFFRLLLTRQGNLAFENLVLRQQLNVYARKHPKPKLANKDRLLLMAMTKLWAGWRTSEAFLLVRPETVIRWHRAGFRRYWRWRSQRRCTGRPSLPAELRQLVRQMATENAGWGAPRIHGELLKLGVDVSQATVSKWMPRRPRQPLGSQTWTTFLRNHLAATAAIDFFTVSTAAFRQLYVCVVVACDRRVVRHVSVTSQPTAAWAAQCVVEAFPEDTPPRYLVRNRDSIFGETFTNRMAGMGLEEVVTSVRSPWQNCYAERLIGSIRRECLDRVIVLSESHLRRILSGYFDYYHHARTHLGLGKDAPVPRRRQVAHEGRVVAVPMVGGLHHRYERRAAA